MPMELHVWGNSTEYAIIDPESIASIWLLQQHVPSSEYTVIPSSNNNLSPTGKLPVLFHDEKVIDGYVSIVSYLNELGYEIDTDLNTENQALNQGLITYSQTELSLIVNYALYLNKKNYEEYTRGIFAHYLTFPLQYNTPIFLRSKAKEICATIGLHVEDKSDLEEDMLKSIPTISSKIQKLKNDQMVEYKLLMKNSKTNFKCLNYVQTHLIEFLHVLIKEVQKLQAEESRDVQIFPIFRKDKIASSGELLLLAYLNTLLSSKLQDQFIQDYIKVSISSSNFTQLTSQLTILNESLKEIPSREPKFWSEKATIFNSF